MTAADLHALAAGNRVFKYADDIFLVVPDANSNTSAVEVRHIEARATTNNLKLNRSKSKEVILYARRKRGKSVHVPPPCQDIEQVRSLKSSRRHRQRRLTTSTTCCRRPLACSMLYGSRAVTVFQHLRCKRSFVQLLLRRPLTVRQSGLVPVLWLIVHGLTRFSDAVNDKISVQGTRRQSVSCLTTQMRHFQASHLDR